MINDVRIRNFKRFVDQSFRLTPLTVLTGLNSSGKSTVAQALLLAHHAETCGSDAVPLNGEPGLRLGQPADVLAVDALTTLVRVNLDINAVQAHWSFETQFDGADSANHVICTDRSGALPSPTYLGAERLGPRSSHAAAPVLSDGNEAAVALGDDGRFTAHTLAVHGRREVTPSLIHPSQTRVSTLLSQTEAWMGDLVGPVQFDARLVPRTDLATLHVRSSGADDWFLPANVGFGISYALPIVVAGLTVGSQEILMVDSPEAHLHPAAQSALARFLARVAASGIQVLIETHSDHVLNGVRRAVVENVLQSNDVVFHFLSGDDEPVTIDIDDRGRPSVWPPGFFDQLEADLRSITTRRKSQ